jgi:hypothetical protein
MWSPLILSTALSSRYRDADRVEMSLLHQVTLNEVTWSLLVGYNHQAHQGVPRPQRWQFHLHGQHNTHADVYELGSPVLMFGDDQPHIIWQRGGTHLIHRGGAIRPPGIVEAVVSGSARSDVLEHLLSDVPTFMAVARLGARVISTRGFGLYQLQYDHPQGRAALEVLAHPDRDVAVSALGLLAQGALSAQECLQAAITMRD